MKPAAARGRTEPGHAFRLDPFQVEANAALDRGESVLVAAPTGAGKTVVAEHAVAAALVQGWRAFYTTPIKALSNQKYHDLARLHGGDRVGLLTGDNSVRGDADVVVMTTEVLRNMIYARSAALDQLGVVVLDEVHYLQDTYRGAVWEEVIIHLAPEVRLVCLSATVSNARELADWLTTVRGPTTAVIETQRPVTLSTHYLAGDRLTEQLRSVPLLIDGRPNPDGAHFDRDDRRLPGRGRGRPRRRWYPPGRVEVIDRLADEDLLPALYFIFSRAACDDAVAACLRAGVKLTGAAQRQRVDQIVEDHVGSLADADLAVLGFDRFLAGLEAGIASHHAGLVPPFKEAVEQCFVEGLVRVVFATETLALGVNLPARTVVVEKLTKFTGEHHEVLTAGQFTQLTGRAGRRGLDDEGHAVVLWSPWTTFAETAALAASRSFELRSAFRPTYNMVANLVDRYDRGTAHHMLNLSFAQFHADRSVVRLAAAHRDLDGDHRLRREATGSLARQFDRVLRLLEAWGCVDGWHLTDQGRRLAGLYHELDLLVAQSLEEGLLDGLDPASLAGVVSCFTYEHRSPVAPEPAWFPSSNVRHRVERIQVLATDLIADEQRLGLPVSRRPDPTFLALAHAWAAGDSLGLVLEDEDLSGGDFVRNVRQLVDLLRQIADTAPDPDTAATARQAAAAVFRGVVEASTAIGVEPASPTSARPEAEAEPAEPPP